MLLKKNIKAGKVNFSIILVFSILAINNLHADTLPKNDLHLPWAPALGNSSHTPKKRRRHRTMKHHKASGSEESTSASPVTGSALRPEQRSDDAPDKVHTP